VLASAVQFVEKKTRCPHAMILRGGANDSMVETYSQNV
jgi:hypothetical protein